MILKQLGIFGWREADENLVLASLLTGDPLLLIGNHGCAKTHVANKVAQALGRRFLVYDSSKAMFEDVLGYPNVEKLKQGVVEYVPSPVTIWDKELVLIDELNRAVPELQSKWLEIIRSRKIMGFPTQVKWVWSAMNPMSYSATNALDAALIGRFSFFVYPPDVLQMEEDDRIRVTMHINGDDAPSLSEWTDGVSGGTVPKSDVLEVGAKMREMLMVAGKHFLRLREQMPTLAEFLAKFSDLLMRETKGEVALDGRRLGFIHRNLIANRAIELAKAEVFQTPLPDFVQSARFVVQSSIPVGLNDEALKREEAVHKMEICFDLLSSYFEEGAELALVNLVYELFTTPNLIRKAEILLTQPLGEMALSKAWTDLMAGKDDLTLLAYTALQVEARRPGTIPQELLASLSTKIEPSQLSSACIMRLEGDAVEYIEEVEALLAQETELGKLVAYHRVSELVETGNVNPKTIKAAGDAIIEDIRIFEALLTGSDSEAQHLKGQAA
jgi:MoxR-like ATPase